MGGQLALFAAATNDAIGACVNYYGIHPKVQPSLRDLQCPVLGIFGELDHTTPLDVVNALDVELTALGKEHEFVTYPGARHAFFNNDRPEVYDRVAAEDSWQRMMEFLRANLPETK
jgi:carboxymethylenebutenolidase